MPSPDELAFVRLKNSSDIPRKHGIELTATIVEPKVTVDNTAKIRITVSNISNSEKYIRAGNGTRDVFSTNSNFNTPPSILLVTAEEASTVVEGRKPKQKCWRLSKVPRNTLLEQRAILLKKGEEASLDLLVWGHPDLPDDTCFPRGSYEFIESYSYKQIGGKNNEFEWKFSIHI